MPLESRVDVLIIGAGPAGLMCANALASAGENVRIIDKRPHKVLTGHADGIAQRMIEVFQSYGLADRLLREGNRMYMCTTYNPGRDGGIECTERIYDVVQATGRYQFMVTLNQGAIEAIFIDSLRAHGVEIERPKHPVAMEISEDAHDLSDPSAYPVKVTVERLDTVDEESKTEVIHAKFVVGADGAHSWVRKTLGIEMEGEQTDYVWGVVDMVPETNFPDIRNIAMIHSLSGSGMIIPREGDLVRFYTQLVDADVVDPLTGRLDKTKINAQKLVSVVRKILHPYELENPKDIDWWTVYIIGQRLASTYSFKNRIFIAGDACHTHSPKAGQGMNASMSDTHNLAWKLALVLRGWSNSSLLQTYEHERRKFAEDLINFDKKFAALFSGEPSTAQNEDGVSPEEFARMVQTHGDFINGIGVRYPPSAIVDPKHQKYANNLTIGARIPPQIFVRAADIRPIEIHDMLPSDLRFKVLFFVGNLTEARVAELNLLAEELQKPASFFNEYSGDVNVSTVFDIVTIISGKKESINFMLLPAFFRPHWSKVLLDDRDVTGKQGGRAYEKFGISPEQITIVVVRPDGYVGTVVPSMALADLRSYLGAFLVSRAN